MKYKNVAIWICTPKSDIESEENKAQQANDASMKHMKHMQEAHV